MVGSTIVSGKLRNSADGSEQSGEASWIAASQRGDAIAFNRLVLKWERSIYNLSLRMLQNPEDAEEATQEVFLRAFRSIRSFRHSASFSTWLYRIAANQCMSRLRKRGNRIVWSLDGEESQTAIDRKLPHQESHENQFLQQETDSKVREALGRLSPEQQLVIELKFFQELTFEEIAEIVQAPLSTVKSRLYGGFEVLKRCLSRHR